MAEQIGRDAQARRQASTARRERVTTTSSGLWRPSGTGCSSTSRRCRSSTRTTGPACGRSCGASWDGAWGRRAFVARAGPTLGGGGGGGGRAARRPGESGGYNPGGPGEPAAVDAWAATPARTRFPVRSTAGRVRARDALASRGGPVAFEALHAVLTRATTVGWRRTPPRRVCPNGRAARADERRTAVDGGSGG